MVNTNFRKLKKNNVKNTNKTWQLKQEVLELSSSLRTFTQECSVGMENKRSFVDTKPVGLSVLEHVTIWQFIFAKVV